MAKKIKNPYKWSQKQINRACRITYHLGWRDGANNYSKQDSSYSIPGTKEAYFLGYTMGRLEDSRAIAAAALSYPVE